MTSDEIVRARVGARRADLRRSAGHRRPRAGRRRVAEIHLRLWWAVRPRRRMTCLVTTSDGAAVLAGAGEPAPR